MLLAGWGAAQDIVPYAVLGEEPYEYTGEGREADEPTGLDQVRIGLWAPRAGDGSSLRRGAELAINEANAGGGYEGLPFSLVVRDDESVWGSAREVVSLAYEDRVWAVLGAVGGESTHVAQQIITKARLPLVGTSSTDSSLTQINIPWMFRLLPDDDHIARLIVEHLQQQGHDRVAVVASTAYDSRLRARAHELWASRAGRPLVLSLRFDSGDTGFDRQIALIQSSGARTVVVWAGAEDGARLLRALAGLDPRPQVFAGPWLAASSALAAAGPLAEGVTAVVPAAIRWTDEPARGFVANFRALHGCAPDLVAASGYDGASLLIEAIREAGLNRVRIRDALAARAPYDGVTGTIDFDATGANTALPALVTVREGIVVELGRRSGAG